LWESKCYLRAKPSIAALPFQGVSGDAEREYFADGMVEDITTGLSRIKWLFVTVRDSGLMRFRCRATQAIGCESAWNKDPVFGVIGIQSGPGG
jgi:TolB-like protein